MGGGAAISIPGTFRVATEKTVVYLPLFCNFVLFKYLSFALMYPCQAGAIRVGILSVDSSIYTIN